MDYCRRSANPVGRLLLHLYGETAAAQPGLLGRHLRQPATDQLSAGRRHRLRARAASICRRTRWRATASASGRSPRATRAARGADSCAHQIERARRMLQAGAPLGRVLPGRLGLELRMIVLGGERILSKLQAVAGRCVQPPAACSQRVRLGLHDGCARWEADEPGRVLPAEGRGERLELLLQLPVPAPRAAARDHRAVRVLPRGRRRRGRSLGPRRGAQQARVVAAGDRRHLCRHRPASGRTGAGAGGAHVRTDAASASS